MPQNEPVASKVLFSASSWMKWRIFCTNIMRFFAEFILSIV